MHLVTPIPTHADLALRVLRAGKHCACTVPMGTTREELAALVDAERASGLVYMMMETAVYTHHCLYVQGLQRSGELGTIQFLRGAHYQDMTGWPEYWLGLPPMHYATHAVSPLLAIEATRATSVRCLGSGTMDESLTSRYGNPYPVESAIFTLESPRPLAMEVTRSLFETARDYMESFNIYGTNASFEWHMENELPVLFRMQGAGDTGRGRTVGHERVTPPDTSTLLPPQIARHSRHQVVSDQENPHLSLLQGGGHHGSHPHLVHEFVRSIVERRRSRIDSVTAAEWTSPGVCAHESAMAGGVEVELPDFRS